MSAMNPLQKLMAEQNIDQVELVRATGLGRSTISRIVSQDIWPRRGAMAKQARENVRKFFLGRGFDLDNLPAAVQPGAKRKAPGASTPEAETPEASVNKTQEVDGMLLRNENLTTAARKAFNIPRSPFVDDVATPDDVFQSPAVRYVRAALLDCANHHGFLAVVGESGAGKSTLAEDLEERIKVAGHDITVIRPYVLAMEQNDIKGKSLKSSHIAEACAAALDSKLTPKSSPEARFGQLHALLKASRKAGRRHLVLLEEAHCLPTQTLKHLKRFLELKDGMNRLLGVSLIAQPELLERLTTANPELREVVQRLEVVQLEPLDQHVEDYLRFKFARFEVKYDDVFEADVADAIRARLVRRPRGGKDGHTLSICHPLVVNNLVIRAMNAATAAGFGKVNAQVIAGC